MQVQSQERYKVINTTVKKPRLDPVTKKDMRTAGERVGHSISIRLLGGQSVMVTPQREGIVPYVDEGMLKLVREGKIVIQKFGDVTQVLADHALTSKAVAAAEPKNPARSADHGTGRAQDQRNVAHAVEMGRDDYREGTSTEYAGATNPDGNPNFLVTATKDNLKTAASRKKEIAAGNTSAKMSSDKTTKG